MQHYCVAPQCRFFTHLLGKRKVTDSIPVRVTNPLWGCISNLKHTAMIHSDKGTAESSFSNTVAC